MGDGILESGLASLTLRSMEKIVAAPSFESLENFCAACQRLLKNEIEVAKPCSYTSPYERKRSKDEFRIVEEYFVHHEDGGRGLGEAATRGCVLCRHIYLSMSKAERESICQNDSKTGFEASDFVTRYKFRFNTCDTTLSKYCTMEYKIRTVEQSIAENTGQRLVCFGISVEKKFCIMPCLGKCFSIPPKL